jgi:hypothetical protein
MKDDRWATEVRGPGMELEVVMVKVYKCFIYGYCIFVYFVANKKTSRSSVGYH